MGLLPDLSVCQGFQLSVMGDVIGLGWTSKENSYASGYSRSKACCVSCVILSFTVWEWAVACKSNLLPKTQESLCEAIKLFSPQGLYIPSYSVFTPPPLPWQLISLLLPAILPSPLPHILSLVSASLLQIPRRLQGSPAGVYSQLVPGPALLCRVLSIHGNILIVPLFKTGIQCPPLL